MSAADNVSEARAPARKRGRPASGEASTPAQRQARYREKLAAQGKTELPAQIVSTQVAQALERFVQFKDMTIGQALDKIIGHRLLRNRSGKRKPKAQRAQEARP